MYFQSQATGTGGGATMDFQSFGQPTTQGFGQPQPSEHQSAQGFGQQSSSARLEPQFGAYNGFEAMKMALVQQWTQQYPGVVGEYFLDKLGPKYQLRQHDKEFLQRNFPLILDMEALGNCGYHGIQFLLAELGLLPLTSHTDFRRWIAKKAVEHEKELLRDMKHQRGWDDQTFYDHWFNVGMRCNFRFLENLDGGCGEDRYLDCDFVFPVILQVFPILSLRVFDQKEVDPKVVSSTTVYRKWETKSFQEFQMPCPMELQNTLFFLRVRNKSHYTCCIPQWLMDAKLFMLQNNSQGFGVPHAGPSQAPLQQPSSLGSTDPRPQEFAAAMKSLENPSLKGKKGCVARLTEGEVQKLRSESIDSQGNITFLKRIQLDRGRISCGSLEAEGEDGTSPFKVRVKTKRGYKSYIPFGYNANVYLLQKCLECILNHQLDVSDTKVPELILTELKKTLDGPDLKLRIKTLCQPASLTSALLIRNEIIELKTTQAEQQKKLEEQQKKQAEQQKKQAEQQKKLEDLEARTAKNEAGIAAAKAENREVWDFML